MSAQHDRTTADFDLIPSCLSRVAADRALTRLRAEVPWETRSLRLFGRTIPIPRLTCWYGDPGASYRWSGQTMAPRPWTEELLRIRDRIGAAAPGTTFNSVLLNLYRDGSDSVAWHSDDEPELGPAPVVLSVSLGATRTFEVRSRTDAARRRSFALTHGSLLVMHAGVQAAWQHRMPKERRVSGSRINLTFRRVCVPDGRGGWTDS